MDEPHLERRDNRWTIAARLTLDASWRARDAVVEEVWKRNGN